MAMPSGYKRLEYIQSSGTQYVDSGFIPNQDTRVKVECALVPSTEDTRFLLGSRSAANSNEFQIATSSGYYRTDYNTTHSNLSNTSYGNEKFYIDKNKNVTNLNNEYSATATYSRFSCTVNLYIFGTNNNGSFYHGATAKVYTCKIYDNDVLIRDFIPCQKPDGTVGLWDNVNSVFYGNAGTGTFTSGPVIAISAAESEIKKLEYIQSSGTQYINTGFAPNNLSRVVLDAQMVNATSQSTLYCPFGCRGGEKYFELYKASTSNWNLTFLWGSTYSKYFSIDYSARHVFEINKNVAKVDDTSLTYTNTTFSVGYSLFIGADNNAGSANAITPLKTYSGQVYDDGMLVRDYIAAKLSDGTVGLYDKVNGLLFINIGSGDFTAGPELGPQTPKSLKLVSSTESTVTLSWDAVNDVTGYKLYRGGVLIASLAGTSYTDSIEPFVSYVYTLTSYNDNGESDPATISVQVIIPPETPSNFRVVSKSIMEISLAWDAVSGSDSYQLKRDGTVVYTGEFPSYTDSGLTVDTAYTYTLSAVNTAGGSAETTLEAATTQFILVTDRTQADVDARNENGAYNASDLNRVGAAVQYVADLFHGLGYGFTVSPKTDWKDTDWPTPSDMERYLQDVSTLRGLIAQMEATPNVPDSMDKLTHLSANDIEQILMDLDDSITRMKASMFYAGEIYSGEV